MSDTVWIDRGGRRFWVDRDGEEHKRLLTEGGVEVDGPDGGQVAESQQVEPEPVQVEPDTGTEPAADTEDAPVLGEEPSQGPGETA